MRKCYFSFAAGLAVGGATLILASVAEAGKGKSGLVFRSSGGSSNLSVRSKTATSPRKSSSSPKILSKNFTTNSSQFNKNFSSQPLQKIPAGNFSNKNVGQIGTSLQHQRSFNKNLAQKNLSSGLNSAMLKKGPTTTGNLRNQVFNPGNVANLQKNSQIGSSFNVGNGPSSGTMGNFPGAANQINKGAIQDAINNGRLTPIGGGIGNGNNPGDGNGTQPGNDVTGRLKPIELANVLESITDRSIPNIGVGDENPPRQNPSPDADPVQNPSPDADPVKNPSPDADPGQGNEGAEPPANPETPADPNEPPYCPPEDDNDCPFPWWPPVAVGGGCYDDGCYSCVVGTPVTNVTVVEQTVAVPAVETTAAPSIVGVDIELFDVRLVDSGDTTRNLGPRYRVLFRNRGTLPAGNFQLLVMASRDGKPSVEAPRAIADVVSLIAGETLSADLRMPNSNDLASLGAIIVAVDSAVQIDELDEQNNVAVLDRAKIVAVEPASVATR